MNIGHGAGPSLGPFTNPFDKLSRILGRGLGGTLVLAAEGFCVPTERTCVVVTESVSEEVFEGSDDSEDSDAAALRALRS